MADPTKRLATALARNAWRPAIAPHLQTLTKLIAKRKGIPLFQAIEVALEESALPSELAIANSERVPLVELRGPRNRLLLTYPDMAPPEPGTLQFIDGQQYVCGEAKEGDRNGHKIYVVTCKKV